MRIDVVTLFPQMFEAVSHYGITRRAMERKIVELGVWNPRDYTQDRHRTVDDRPYGGGPGMIMKPEPLFEAVESIRKPESRVILMTPQGRRFDQSGARYVGCNALLSGLYSKP